jgi:hypothetical protein
MIEFKNWAAGLQMMRVLLSHKEYLQLNKSWCNQYLVPSPPSMGLKEAD